MCNWYKCGDSVENQSVEIDMKSAFFLIRVLKIMDADKEERWSIGQSSRF